MSPGFTGRTPTRPRLRWSERRSGSLTAPQRDTSDWRAIAASSPRHRPERLRPMANIAKRPDGRWRARYRDPSGKEHAGHFPRKVDAQKWLDRETAKLQTGTWVEPKSSKITVAEWCQTWLAGYGTRKHSTVRGSPRQDHGSVRVASARLPATLGHQVMTVQLQVEHADSYVYALHARLAQILSDAVHDGVLARSPASRRTSPRTGSQRPYVASTEQIWELHDAMGERYRAGLLLGRFRRSAARRGLRAEGRRHRFHARRGLPGSAASGRCTQDRVLPDADPDSGQPGTYSVGPCRGLLGLLAARGRVGSPARTVAVTACLPGSTGEGARPAGGVPLPRPPALLRLAADRLRPGREGSPNPTPACLSQDHVGHLRPSLARLR